MAKLIEQKIKISISKIIKNNETSVEILNSEDLESIEKIIEEILKENQQKNFLIEVIEEWDVLSYYYQLLAHR